MFSFYAIWFGLDRIYTFGVPYLFLMVVLHLKYMNVLFTSALWGLYLSKALSHADLRILCPPPLTDPTSSYLLLRKPCCFRSYKGKHGSLTGMASRHQDPLCDKQVTLSLSHCGTTAQRITSPQTLLLSCPATG